MNFRVVLILVCIGLVSVAMAGFVPRHDDFGKMVATTLLTIGTGLVSSGLTVLMPQARTILGGERSTDVPVPVQPQPTQAPGKEPNAR